MAPLLGIGIYYIHDFAEGGISIDNLLTPSFSLDDQISYKSVPTLSIIGEYHWYPTEELSVLWCFPDLPAARKYPVFVGGRIPF